MIRLYHSLFVLPVVVCIVAVSCFHIINPQWTFGYSNNVVRSRNKGGYNNNNNNNNYHYRKTTTQRTPTISSPRSNSVIITTSLFQSKQQQQPQQRVFVKFNHNNSLRKNRSYMKQQPTIYNLKQLYQSSSTSSSSSSSSSNIQKQNQNDSAMIIDSNSTTTTTTTMDVAEEDPVTIQSFSPSYLEQIDKFRGYRRKYMLRKLKQQSKRSRTTKNFFRNLRTKIVADEMIDDIQRRRQYYLSDWLDAFKDKRTVVPGILFLYFSCLSPAVSFGTIASQITSGSMGIVEFLLSSGVSGMLYAILSGQPMSFIAPTGLTLAFISGLYNFCSVQNLPFFPVYSWVGIWTSIIFVFLGLGGSSQLIRFCTRFTDEIFNALLSVNFLYEAMKSIQRNFQNSDPSNLTMPFVALAMALSTFYMTLCAAMFESSKYLNQQARTVIKNYGPLTIFIVMTCINQASFFKTLNVPTLTVPNSFQLAGGRPFFIPLNTIPLHIKLLCSFPAMLLSALFFMDQNISVRVVNNPDNKLKKGSAYNVDMVALGFITGIVSLVGLPWMCGATVQSLSHVRAMTKTRYNERTQEPEIVSVTETRTVGFVVHALITGTIFLLPLLGYVPIPVVSGVFLFLGRKLMSGNSFLQRIRDMFVETSRLPEDHPIKYIGRKKTTIFTAIQILCLGGLWAFKQNKTTAVFFPGVIGLLILTRSYILPKYFTENELIDLGDPTPT